TSNQTGPSADHSVGDVNYIYVEASGFNNRTAILNSPCFDLTNMVAPKFSFWYHMYGTTMGELHVDAYFGGQWIQDIMPVISGNQGNQWHQKEVNLAPFVGNVIKLRFRALTANNYLGDIALDDIEVIESNVNDLELISIVSPTNEGCHGM